MKYSLFLAFSFIPNFLTAQEAPSTDKKNEVIVIQNPQGGHSTKDATKVFVENGSDTIQGSPEDTVKGAYRTWQAACHKWKNELRQNNHRNLLFSSCGSPKRTVESLQSQKVYTYSSKGSFKIRVANK